MFNFTVKYRLVLTCRKLTPCSLILSDSHLSSFKYSLLDAKQARSITKANGVAFRSMDRACKYEHMINNKTKSFTYVIEKQFKLENWHSQRGPRWGHVTMTLTFDPKIYWCLPFFILNLCMKYEVSRSNTFRVIALQRSVDRQTDRRADRQTDGQSDYYRAPASSMAGP